MKKQHIQKIREACIKANPELSYNHYFEGGKALCKWCSIPSVWVYRKIPKIIMQDKTTGGSIQEVEETRYDEVGKPCPKSYRPIHLADVLLAIKEKLEFHNEDIQILTDGYIGYRLDDSKESQERILKGINNCHWNLKETLENQSEETLSFISNLL
jgi:hypothetical protein